MIGQRGDAAPIAEVSSPTQSSGAPQKYESLSPGDVESISEGEIPETEADLEADTVVPKLEPTDLEANGQEAVGLILPEEPVAAVLEVVPPPEKEMLVVKSRPTTPPILPSSSPVANSPVKVAVPSPTIHPSTPPAVIPPNRMTTPADSPIPLEESAMDVEQFEPILSDEDIVDENDQFQDDDYEFSEEVEEPVKSFNPFNCELHSLVYLADPSLSACEAEEKRLYRLRSVLQLGKVLPAPKEALRLEDIVLVQGKTCTISIEDSVNNTIQVQEDWVHLAEQVPSLLMKGLPYVTNYDDVVSSLLKWVSIGLDFSLALDQPQPGYKVRHIKAGVRLVEAMCQCGESMVKKLLKAQDIHSALLELYHRDYMALSIKLMILRALDASLCCQFAVEHFMGHHQNMRNENGDSSKNGYRTLIEMIQGHQLARVKFAISCLLRKIHTYEVLAKLNECVKLLIENNPLTMNEEGGGDASRLLMMKERSPEGLLSNLEVPEKEVEIIVACLDEVLRLYREAPLTMSQPKRFLPVNSQFEISMCPQDPYPSFFSFFNCHRLLECCLILLSCPSTAGYSSITGTAQEVVSTLLDSQEGMQYLASNTEVSSAILRVLLQQAPPVSPGPPEEGLEEGGSSAPPAQQLGLFMAYKLQALHYVDCLFDIISISEANQQPLIDPDQTDVLDNLYGLYSLGYSPAGKLSLVHTLSRGSNASVVLHFASLPEMCPMTLLNAQPYQLNCSKMKKSPGKLYAADLIVLTVKYSDYVPFLQKFGKDILEIVIKEEENCASTRLFEVVPWIKVVENPTVFVYDDIRFLSEIVKRNVDTATSLSGEIITAMRILKYLGIPPRDKDLIINPDGLNSEEYIELKYKYVILQLFSLEGVSTIVSIFQKLCEFYEQPSLHSTNFVGHQGSMLVALVLPAMQLLRRMLTHVIHCRNTEFKDLTAVPVLLQVYSLMHAFPATALSYTDSQRVCREIIETLLAYTQPVSSDPASETEALNRSLWTMMMSEVVKYVTIGPHTFIPGLLILSELLPLPLPVQTRTSLSEEETNRIINSRKLWSAHLHSLGSGLQELIATMSGSSFQPLLQLLRRVCVQLADLAAPTALIVSRGVLDTVLDSLQLQTLPQAQAQPPAFQHSSPVSQQSPVPVAPGPESPCSGHSARLLNFLACLVTHASVKPAVLHLLSRGGGTKADERYPGLVLSLCSILRSPSDSPSHIQAQECVVSVIQSLCDTEVTLLSPPSNGLCNDSQPNLPTADVYLANALPPRDLLLAMITVMLEHISNIEHSFTTLLPTVRTFLMLTEHDFGFYHLKSCLEKKTDALWNLFIKFCTGFSKDSSDCLSTLSTSMELLRVFISVEEEETGLSLPVRTMLMSVPELALVLGWNKQQPQQEEEGSTPQGADTSSEGEAEMKDLDSTSLGQNRKKHPLFCLEKLLQDCSSEEEALESLHDNVTSLIRLLQEEGGKTLENKDVVEPVLPAPETLLAQFSARPVFMVGEVDDERLGSTYWLAPPPVDEADQDMEQVTCDLMEITRLYLPDFHLPMETERLYRLKEMSGDEEEGDQIKKRGEEMNKYLAADNKNKRPFVAPMRGRGFGRSVPQRGDLFRSRPPNTSRPPSLHVDDFVALEISGQQPTGPTGYNKISMRAAKDIIATRSRGRGRAFASDRGRFFGSTTQYNRRENGRGIPRGVSSMPPRVGNGRGAGSPAWPPHSSEGPSPTNQTAPSRSFRTPEMRDIRMIPRSEEKFSTGGTRFGSGRGIRGGGQGGWQTKENRERFGGPNVRGGGRRDTSARHVRAFTR